MKERIEYYDVAKGILILLVVLGHVFETGIINQYIYSFHMPAFFIISGIIQNYSSVLKKPLKDAIIRKIYTLIVPFLFFELIGVLFNIARFGVTLNIFGYASNTLSLRCNNGPDWFIWALFVDEILFLLIHHFLKNKYIIWAASFGIGLFMIINYKFYLFGSTGVGFLFLTFGYYAIKLFNQKRNIIIVVVAGAVSIITCALNGKVDLGPWQFGFVPYYIISALAGTILVIEISKYIHSKWLTYYGRNTLTVMGTHQAINLTFKVRAGIESYTFPMGIVMLFAISMLEIGIIRVFNRYITFLIGKGKIYR